MGPARSERSRSRQAMADAPRNRREAIAAMDFFTVPTLTFGVLYWHAAWPIMPTPYRSQRLGGTNGVQSRHNQRPYRNLTPL